MLQLVDGQGHRRGWRCRDRGGRGRSGRDDGWRGNGGLNDRPAFGGVGAQQSHRWFPSINQGANGSPSPAGSGGVFAAWIDWSVIAVAASAACSAWAALDLRAAAISSSNAWFFSSSIPG